MKLDLLIPHLLSPPSAAVQLSACPLLETWLARSVMCDASPDYHAQLFSLLNLPSTISLAYLSSLADGCDTAYSYWRADPVQFQAQSDHALLRDGQSLNITSDEAAQLVLAFNQHFAADGVQLFAATPQRWYLQSQPRMSMQTTPTTNVIARNVRHFLPQGADAVRWRKIMTEAQMLFYAHPVNQQREASGQFTINSLWLWGEGSREPVVANSSVTVYANEVIACGGATLLKALCLSCEDWQQQPVPGLLVLDDLIMAASYADAAEWQRGFDQLCQHTLPRIFNAFKDRKITQINLYPADGRCFTLQINDLNKFWRWRKPLAHWMRYEN